VDTLPSVYELVQLKDTFHRYVLLISTETHARILEISLGSVTKQLWAERPELRKRVGREWTHEHFQCHQRNRAERFVKEKIEILDRLVSDRQHTHLMLAGSARAVARVRHRLPKRLLDKLIDVVPIPGRAATADVVVATLSNFADHEQRESVETAGLLLDELRRDGLALAGTTAVLQALVAGQVDVLVLAEKYRPPAGWSCRNCAEPGVGPVPRACPRCGERKTRPAELRETAVLLAERSGSVVEIVRDSDALLEIGGVGCLLRYLTPEQHMAKT
jgi:peptide subunit release factor 1 (eRF1)